MIPEHYGITHEDHIPGRVLHKYLTDLSKKFGIFSRTRFNTRVESLEPTSDGGWKVVTTTNGEKEQTLHSKKVIVATGLTSAPNFPQYPGAETFNAPYFHAKDSCRQGGTVKTAKRAVVVGGAKSAMDVAFAYAAEGVPVDMVIRPSGNGPVWISYPHVMGGKRLEQLLHVRWMQWFSPCPFGGGDSWLGRTMRNFLHGTAIGRFLTDQFWAGLSGEVVTNNGYKTNAELGKLQPWNPAFWIASGLSIHNFDRDFFNMVKNGEVKVHSADVERMTDHTVHLSDGTEPKTDVLVCATGWRKEPSIRFLNFGTAGIGLPYTPTEQSSLATDYDDKILKMYPRLATQPTLNFKPKADPFRLYRFMVPPARIEDRNIAFAGMISSVSTTMVAAVQALWISAYLDGKLDHAPGSKEEVTKEVMLHTQWGKWRYPCGYGASLHDFAFDGVPYNDLLLKDLGVKANRKQGWKDVTEPYQPPDYKGIIDEWLELNT
ncbi:FAD-dependent monooxygenase DEP4 [Fulvia fulva]|uniref:FAD-dependent monooxygenase DEP4 n=1 Tax=Passalora fulva TaxID=5499 RepID=A0A9Q8P9S8_PASFU|nr:FAD-dependent monooxygenase DEP4 [Fulvia fulva]KAK4624726.1 FAD-dependent monooxygenase DEP4 [Fulvia fulva]KAK4626007.1 FAD-dependent monooxygenase DEP4 [Fulvia fulva]UJO18271.1 FAD-dependent monooxygenase DEP4 [Fulvia fulva]WPV14926.1 FAD-dependent monooxygenase DEP4 [Fulvia fulva]WPV30053.1 FAD-dependent monooxygenase DEP4 [Fulvia fulva]